MPSRYVRHPVVSSSPGRRAGYSRGRILWGVEFLAGLLVLGPLALLLVLLAIRTRQLWPKRPATWWTNGGERGDGAGDREPRRPLVPSGAASVALTEPHDERRVS